MDIKQCRGCGKYLPLTSFSFHKAGKMGRRSRCRQCESDARQAIRIKELEDLMAASLNEPTPIRFLSNEEAADRIKEQILMERNSKMYDESIPSEKFLNSKMVNKGDRYGAWY